MLWIHYWFLGLSLTSSKILCLVPSVLCDKNKAEDHAQCLKSVIEAYRRDLPSPELIEWEVQRWKVSLQRKFATLEKMPRTVAQALRVCDEIYYPNLYILLKIFSTIPSTSCECERSASALRRLSTYMRASMGQVRLSALAMIHFHYDTSISIEQAVDIFARMHPRKMQLGSVLAWLSLHKKVIMQTKEKVSRDIVFDIFNTEHMKIINV